MSMKVHKLFLKIIKLNLKKAWLSPNEPGYYEKNKFGIRIENLIYVKKGKKGRYFKNLTVVPIDN